MEENPKQENASAKSDAGKIGLEVVASKEEGDLGVDHVGHMADTCNTPFIAPHLSSSSRTLHASGS